MGSQANESKSIFKGVDFALVSREILGHNRSTS